jgi:DHA3 family macrolide efflux protein-like MFS transporter
MTSQPEPSSKQAVDIPENWQRPFFSIWIGQALSLAGSRVVQFALIWWLALQADRATVLTTATIVALVPEILLSPIAGAYIDRWNRRLVLIFADATVALGALILGYLFWSGNIEIWHIYALMFVRSLAGSFHWPAMQASTSLMVPDHYLTRVAGVNQALNGALTIVGPLLGALAVEALTMGQVMAIDVGTALLAIIPLLFVFIPQPKRTDQGEEKSSIWSDLAVGFRYVIGWRGLLAIIFAAMLIHLVLTPAFTLLPLLVKNHFGGGAVQLGILEGVSGIGMLLGGLILGVWGGFQRRIYTSLIGIIFMGLSLILLGFTPGAMFWLALVSVFIMGLMIPFVDGPIMAIMQANVEADVQARVFTMMGSLLAITSPIGLLIAGQLSDLIDLQVWFVAAGFACLAAGIGLSLTRSVIHIEDNRRGAPTEVSGAEDSMLD